MRIPKNLRTLKINFEEADVLGIGLKGFIQFFELEELGASVAHKTEILDHVVLKI